MTVDRLHQIADQVLLDWVAKDEGPMMMGGLSVSYLMGQVEERADQARIRFDWRTVLEYWWHLARLGVIATAGQDLSNMAGRPHTFITLRGREYLRRGALSPHYPSRFLKAVRDRVDEPDDVTLGYLEEAVAAWEAHLYRATMVMVGCAYERIVIELTRALAECGQLRAAEKLAKKVRADRPVGVSELFDDVNATMTELATLKLLPGSLTDAWERRVSSVFDFARGLRNRSGHPSGDQVSAGEAEGALVMFPDFYERMTRLTAAVRALG